jgi:hypothetical protein
VLAQRVESTVAARTGGAVSRQLTKRQRRKVRFQIDLSHVSRGIANPGKSRQLS